MRWEAGEIRRGSRAYAVGAVLGCACMVAAGAAQVAPDLTTLSLEQLLGLTVVGASKYEQKQSEVAAAVRIITRDDFCTGYSSLVDLTRMPIGNIKVNKCFVGDQPERSEKLAIVCANLAMTRSLGIRVTAEGVETLEQVRALTSMAVDCLQRDPFSGPVRG